MRRIIIVGIIILLIVAAFFLGSYSVKYQERKEARLINQGFKETAIQITQTGNIPIVVNKTVQWIPIRDLCGG